MHAIGLPGKVRVSKISLPACESTNSKCEVSGNSVISDIREFGKCLEIAEYFGSLEIYESANSEV